MHILHIHIQLMHNPLTCIRINKRFFLFFPMGLYFHTKGKDDNKADLQKKGHRWKPGSKTGSVFWSHGRGFTALLLPACLHSDPLRAVLTRAENLIYEWLN